MNDMVDVVGFLSLDPAISCMTGEEEMASMHQDDQAERMQHQPPASLVPRLHVLSIKKLEHCNPLLPSFGFDYGKKSFDILTINFYYLLNAQIQLVLVKVALVKLQLHLYISTVLWLF